MRSVFGLIGEHDCAVNDHAAAPLAALMAIHKKIREEVRRKS
jgi:hypothetical protein